MKIPLFVSNNIEINCKQAKVDNTTFNDKRYIV
jgi:hypothetical protein